MAVLKADTALYRYLEVLNAGTKMTVYTRNSPGARTNVLAVLQKEKGWGDWDFVQRPKTSDASQLPATWLENPEVISANDLAKAFENPDLWADVSE